MVQVACIDQLKRQVWGVALREIVADQQSAMTCMIEPGDGLIFMLEEEALQAEEQGRVIICTGERFPTKLFYERIAGTLPFCLGESFYRRQSKAK